MKKSAPYGTDFLWLGDMDSNHDCQDQNLESYH